MLLARRLVNAEIDGFELCSCCNMLSTHLCLVQTLAVWTLAIGRAIKQHGRHDNFGGHGKGHVSPISTVVSLGFMAAVAAIHDGHWRCLAEVPMASCTYCMLQLPQRHQWLLNHLDDLGKVSGSRYLAAATAPDNSRATGCRARYAAASIDLGR